MPEKYPYAVVRRFPGYGLHRLRPVDQLVQQERCVVEEEPAVGEKNEKYGNYYRCDDKHKDLRMPFFKIYYVEHNLSYSLILGEIYHFHLKSAIKPYISAYAQNGRISFDKISLYAANCRELICQNQSILCG